MSVMLTYLPFLLLTTLSVYYAWRYAKLAIDPDQAMYLFEAIGVGWYGKDYADCKSPAIHIWFWILSKVVGKNVERIRFAHYFIVGISSGVVYFLTGNFWVSLGYLVLLQSGWLLAFHGNVGQLPAVFLTIGLASGSPPLIIFMAILATLFEPKLVVTLVSLVVIYSWNAMALAVFAIFLVVALLATPIVAILYNDIFAWLVEANFIIPRKMTKLRISAMKRGALKIWSWYTAQGYVYILPWVAVAVIGTPYVVYWIPPLLYILFIHLGIRVAPNHLIPIIPWIVMSGAPKELLISLILVDWVSGGFYLDDIWDRFYTGISTMNSYAKIVGKWLKDKNGTVWVASLHSAVNIYAEKEVLYGLAEQIEIREVSTERREKMVELWKRHPAEWVVTGYVQEVDFVPGHYYDLAVDTPSEFKVYKRR